MTIQIAKQNDSYLEWLCGLLGIQRSVAWMGSLVKSLLLVASCLLRFIRFVSLSECR